MKGGKRKKQSNDAPLNEIISEMKNNNSKCIPCMIDFEGYSIYHCDTPLHPKKTYQNIFLAKYFTHRQKFIEIKKDQHFLDLSNMNRVDNIFISHFYYIWKIKYIQLVKANIILYFTKWQTRYENNTLRNFLISHTGKRAFTAWRNVLHRSKTEGKYLKRKMKKYFLIMKNIYQGSTFRTKQFQKRSLTITGLSMKRSYFKKWVRQSQKRQLLIKQEKIQNKELELQQKLPFLRWHKYFLLHQLMQKRSKIVLTDSFEYWKNSKTIKQNYIDRMNDIRSLSQKRMMNKIMRRWKQKFTVIRRKKRKANIKLWSLIVYHAINYAQIQEKNSINIEKRLFIYMKKQARKRTIEIGKRVFNNWRRITFLQTAEKSISQNHLKIRCETCIIKWRMRLHNLIDQRIIDEIHREVVEKNLILHCFKIWITKSRKILHHKMKKVKKFRKQTLLIFPFIAWRNLGRLKNLRAEEHLKQKLLSKYFPAFRAYKRLAIEWEYDEAVRFDIRRIKKKFFYRMRKILEERGYNYNNEDDQDVVRLLNRTNNFLYVSRLRYI